MIVDAHAHLGRCRVFDQDLSAEVLLTAMDDHAVAAAIVQPFPGAPDPRAIHDSIAELARQHPGRIFGLASLTPHHDTAAYRGEVRRCISELGFVGVKAHTIGHAVNPLTRDAELIFETAAELGVPVMVHTGPGIPFAEPGMWIPMARAFSNTTVVLAHAGAGIFTGPAIVAAEVCPNIVLETSWCNLQDIGRAVRAVGPDRVLFGSDLPSNLPVELAKYRAAGLSEEQLRGPLGETAMRVFKLRVDRDGGISG